MFHEKRSTFSDFGKGTWTTRHTGITHDEFLNQISFLCKEGKCVIERPGTSFSTSSFLSDSLLLTLVINKLSTF